MFTSRQLQSFLVLLFVLPRLLFLAYVIPFPPALVYPDMEPQLANGAVADGRWITWAKDIDHGDLHDHWEDLGVSVTLLVLNKAGVPYVSGFRLLALALIAFGGLIVGLFYSALRERIGGGTTFGALALVSLYPRGVYFSSYFLSFWFPVLAFGIAVPLLLNQQRLLNGRNSARAALVVAAAVFAWLFLCRRTVEVIVLAAIVAMLINGAWRRAERKNLVLFAFAFLIFMTVGKAVMPRSGHLVWHHIYRGLTNFGNRWGVTPRDGDMQAKARSINPNLSRESIWSDPAYEEVYKKLFIEAVTSHPGWYAQVLAMRAARLVVLPRSGGWLPSLTDERMKELVPLGSLIRGTENLKTRLYVVFYTLSVLLDGMLVLAGFFGVAGAFWRHGWRWSLPYVVLLGSVLYVYILVDAQYNDIYLAGTYVYIFSAGALMARLIKGFCVRFGYVRAG